MLLLLACKLPTHIDPPLRERCALEADIAFDRDHGFAPLPVELTAESTCEEDFEALWLFEDGTTLTGPVLDYTFVASGTHRVELTVSDTKGRSGSAEIEIEVGALECPEQLDPVELGVVENLELTEASGLALGEFGLWSHNDSGDIARLFAMSSEGDDLGVFELSEAEAIDWEDMTAGEGVLYVGDIGDNTNSRDFVTVFMVPDPAENPVEDWASMDLDYPEGRSLDSNTLIFDPLTGDLLLVSVDTSGEVGLYRKAPPHEADTRTELELIATLELEGSPTGGELSPHGAYLVLRTTEGAALWLRDGSQSLAAAVAAEPCPLTFADEPAGEALVFSEDSSGIYTLSEGTEQPIWFVELLPQEQPCEGDGPEIWALPAAGEVPLDIEFSIDCVEVAGVTWTLEDVTVESLTADALYLASGTFPVSAVVEEEDGTRSEVSIDVVVEPADCPVVGPNQTHGELASDELIEASGLAESKDNPGVFWTHNDAGNPPVLFAFGQDGADLGHFEIDGPARDWEDIALGEIDGDSVLFVGDVGDNGMMRETYTILLVPEPEVYTDAEAPAEILVEDFGIMTLTYPDGSYNSEAIAIDPVSGDLVVLTKDYDGHSRVFVKAAPHADGDVAELVWIADIEYKEAPYSGSGATTAMDFSPLGDLIGVRTYSDLWIMRRDQAYDLATAFSSEPCDGEAPSERQAEAMAFSVDGTGYWVVSEGVHEPLHYKSLD